MKSTIWLLLPNVSRTPRTRLVAVSTKTKVRDKETICLPVPSPLPPRRLLLMTVSETWVTSAFASRPCLPSRPPLASRPWPRRFRHRPLRPPRRPGAKRRKISFCARLVRRVLPTVSRLLRSSRAVTLRSSSPSRRSSRTRRSVGSRLCTLKLVKTSVPRMKNGLLSRKLVP